MRLVRRRRPNVQRLKRKGDLEGLRAALAYRDTVVSQDSEWDLGVTYRVEAVEALSQFYGPTVAAGLAEALEDPHPAVRLASVQGLSAQGTPTAVEPLFDALIRWEDAADGEAAVRAVDTLAAWKLEGSVEVFAEKLLDLEAEPLEERHHQALAELLAADPRGTAASVSVAQRLMPTLRESRDEAREARAERILGWLDPAAANAVVEALRDGRVRLPLVRVAGVLGDSRAVDPLVALLERPDAEIRRAAAIALGALNDTRAVLPLVKLTQDPEQAVRAAASGALNRMGMAAVIVGLAALMQAGGPEQLEAAGGPPAPALEELEPTRRSDQASEGPTAGALNWAGEAVGRLLRGGG